LKGENEAIVAEKAILLVHKKKSLSMLSTIQGYCRLFERGKEKKHIKIYPHSLPLLINISFCLFDYSPCTVFPHLASKLLQVDMD
jgi:hypothetical protein